MQLENICTINVFPPHPIYKCNLNIWVNISRMPIKINNFVIVTAFLNH